MFHFQMFIRGEIQEFWFELINLLQSVDSGGLQETDTEGGRRRQHPSLSIGDYRTGWFETGIYRESVLAGWASSGVRDAHTCE